MGVVLVAAALADGEAEPTAVDAEVIVETSSEVE
jgi:hypothetical protein